MYSTKILLLFLSLLATAASQDGNVTKVSTKDEMGSSKAVSYPCNCENGACSCCTGNVLQNFNINMRQKLCSNVTFDAEDFTFGVRIGLNNLVLYQNRISGRNPPPICLPIPRLSALRVCVRLTDVYFIGRNVHACIVVESQWNRETMFNYNFDCMRLGTNGVALVKPEDGGGLAVPSNSAEPSDEIEEYDENVTDSTQRPKPGKARQSQSLNSVFKLFS